MNNLLSIFRPIASNIQSKSDTAIDKLLVDLSIRQPKPSLFPISHTFTKKINKKQNEKLMEKRRQLLRELDQVNIELMRNRTIDKEQKNGNKKRSKSHIQEEQAYNKAGELISRMNSYRKQRAVKKQAEQQRIEKQVEQSKRKLQEMNRSNEKQIQRKREEIKRKIKARRQNILVVNSFNKKADHLITEMQEYRVSLPAIHYHHDNPEQKQSKISSSKHEKKYDKSPFLVTLQQQEKIKKRKEELKYWEKKNQREKQKYYDHQVRSRLKDSHIFVT